VINTFFSIVYFSVSVMAGSRASAGMPPANLSSTISELNVCRQLILVTTPNWNTLNATVHLYERPTAGATSWRETRGPIPAIIGNQGFAWGIGMHGTGAPGEPRKREGDLKSPAGVFRLAAVFGIADPAQAAFLRLPYRQVTSTTEAIDDPNSKYYNQIVDRKSIPHPDWSSAESMLQVGGRYRFGIVIAHNPGCIPGQGSCIFLHVWDKRYAGTTGCTAIGLNDLTCVLHWLDAKADPLIVQLPLPEYQRLKIPWALP
jgi:L,D-peptidoglycan transpeptidase YkuD (ErfK/YbiS/YcfS/YnhG family)